jgi:hypothetical protein
MRNNWLEAQEDTPAMLCDRLVNINQEIVSTSDISSISVSFFNVDSASPTTTYFSTTFGTTCIYTRLKTDNYWKDTQGELTDTIGYNARYLISASAFPIDSKHVRGEWTYTPTTGDAFKVLYDFTVRKVYGS